jgi:hypothetical protein
MAQFWSEIDTSGSISRIITSAASLVEKAYMPIPRRRKTGTSMIANPIIVRMGRPQEA